VNIDEVRDWSLPGPPGTRYTLHEVAKWLDMHDDTLRAMIDLGRFPRGYKATAQAEPVWTGAELAAWLLLRDRWYPEPKPDETGRNQTKRAEPRRKSDDPKPDA
jgi:hypothetical protein